MNDKNEFLYYLHGTNVNNNEILDIFDNGLKSYYGRSLSSTAFSSDDFGENLTLEQKIKAYAGTKGDKVIVIKIPKKYLYPNLYKKDLAPLPIWKETDEKIYPSGNIYRLIPELIVGAYFKDRDKFVSNPKYSIMHDPSGLKYDDSQRDYMRNNGMLNMYNFMTKRNEYTYDELKVSDNLYHTFDEALETYQEYFYTNGSIKK